MAVGVDGIHAEEHPVGNLSCGQTFCTEADDLDFPLREADVGNLAAALKKDVLHVICYIVIDGIGSGYDFLATLPDLVRG